MTTRRWGWFTVLAGLIGLAMVPAGDMPAVDLRVDRRVIVTATAEIHPDTKRVIITDDWLAEWWRIMHEFQGMGFTVELRGER